MSRRRRPLPSTSSILKKSGCHLRVQLETFISSPRTMGSHPKRHVHIHRRRTFQRCSTLLMTSYDLGMSPTIIYESIESSEIWVYRQLTACQLSRATSLLVELLPTPLQLQSLLTSFVKPSPRRMNYTTTWRRETRRNCMTPSCQWRMGKRVIVTRPLSSPVV